MAESFRSDGPRMGNVRRSPRNKRKYQHLIDTNVRSSEADRQRMKRCYSFFAWFFVVTAVMAGTGIGVWKLVKYTLLQNAQYNISVLDVETDGILNPADILEASDLHKGSNIFRVDLARAQARVASIPQVEKVSVSRQLPNRVAIQVNERKPVAWLVPVGSKPTREQLAGSHDAWLIDAYGVALHPRKVSPQDRFLPIIRNFSEGALAEGGEAAGEEVKSALDLIRAQQESANTARFQIEEIDLAKHFGLVVTDRNGLQVMFGLDEMDRQLKRLDVYLQALDLQPQKPQTINLLVEKNVPVTFVTEPVANEKSPELPVSGVVSISPQGAVTAVKDKEKGKGHEAAKNSSKTKGKSPAHPRQTENSRSRRSAVKGQPFLERSGASSPSSTNVGH